MNPTLSAKETDALLDLLHRGLVLIRLAAMAGDTKRAEAIADALHNVPTLLKEGEKWSWTVAELRRLFLSGLTDEYPDLAYLDAMLG
jgi:hypothetical protein